MTPDRRFDAVFAEVESIVRSERDALVSAIERGAFCRWRVDNAARHDVRDCECFAIVQNMRMEVIDVTSADDAGPRFRPGVDLAGGR